jgi:hypothetical protein
MTSRSRIKPQARSWPAKDAVPEAWGIGGDFLEFIKLKASLRYIIVVIIHQERWWMLE